MVRETGHKGKLLQVVVSVKLRCPWISGLSKRFSGRVTLLQCSPRVSRCGVSALAKVATDLNPDPAELTLEVSSLPQIESASFSQVKQGLFLGIVKTRDCPCYKLTLAEHNPIQITEEKDGWLKWVLLLDGYDSLRRLLHKLESNGIDYRIRRIQSVGAKWYLTSKQEEVLRVAYELGFYDVPRKISLKELSKLFGVSTRALSEILRRGEKKAISYALSRMLVEEGT